MLRPIGLGLPERGRSLAVLHDVGVTHVVQVALLAG